MVKPERVLAYRSVKYADHGNVEQAIAGVLQELCSTVWEELDIEERVEKFSRVFASLWRIHPFREGNTRVVAHFCCQFAEERGMPIDRVFLAKNSEYLRTALVAANAIFEEDDLGDKSNPQYLRRIILDAMQRGEEKARATTAR